MRRFWVNATAITLLGYLVLGRSFAYVGLPIGAVADVWFESIYIGELLLATFLLLRPTESWLRLIAWMAGRSPFRFLAWGMTLLLAYGVIQTLRGTLALGFDVVPAVKQFAFNYYPAYLLLGYSVGRIRPEFAQRAVRALAVLNGIYGILYLTLLSHLRQEISAGIPLFGQPGGSALALLGLIAYEGDLRSKWWLVLLNLFVLMGVQVRAEWLALIMGGTVLVVMHHRLVHGLSLAGVALALLAILTLADAAVPIPRGGEISLRGVAARAIAPIAPDAASDMLGPEASAFAGTLYWRTEWWRSIHSAVASDPLKSLLGFGYGYPLHDLVTYVPEDVRTPHNVLLYALGYTGSIGLLLFLGFQGILAHRLWRSARISGNYFGFAVWLAGLAMGVLGNYFETPYGAVPFYVLLGSVLGPAGAKWHGRSTRRQLTYGPYDRRTPDLHRSRRQSTSEARTPKAQQ